MTAMFQPVGERPRWEILYDLLQTLSVGDFVSYEVMASALDVNPVAQRPVVQAAMQRAAKEFLVRDKRDIEVVRGEGYRVIEPARQMQVARTHQRKARRSLKRGVSHVTNVDFSDVAPDTRRAIELLGRAMTMQVEFNRRFEAKQEHLQSVVDSVVTQHVEDRQQVTRQLADLAARLERLEHP